MNIIEGLKKAVAPTVGGITMLVASNLEDGRMINVQAEEVKPQTSQNLVFGQEVCAPAKTLFKDESNGKVFEDNDSCPPKEGGPYQRLDPNGLIFLPGIQNGQIK